MIDQELFGDAKKMDDCVKRLEDELCKLLEKKKKADPGLLSSSPAPFPRAGSHSPVREAENERLIGLAFSGGGIRSATFNLGVLQGLADADLLRQVDYVSAVSGGGYITSWLATWSKRQKDGIRRVQRWLSPWRSPNPDAEEVNPIRFLRRYSNYLTPKKGLLTADTWTAIAIWVRNTFLNQLIIFLFLAVVMLLPRAMYPLMAGTKSYPQLFLLGSIVLSLTGFIIGLHLRQFDKKYSLRQRKVPAWSFGQGEVQVAVVSILVIGAFLITAGAHGFLQSVHHGVAVLDTNGLITSASLVLFLTFTVTQLSGRLAQCFYFLEGAELSSARWFGANIALAAMSAGAALVGALIFTKILTWCFTMESASLQGRLLVFGVPLLLLLLLMSIALQIGFMGVNFPDERREWWGRLAAWLAIYILGWLVIFGTSIYVPLWAYRATAAHTTIAASVWAVWSAIGVIIGRSGKTPALQEAGEQPKKGRFDLLTKMANVAKIAPYVFVAGVFIFVSYVIQWSLLRYENRQGLLRSIDSASVYWGCLISTDPASLPFAALMIALVVGFVLAWRFDVNEFSMHHFYRNRLMRCYQGATRNSKDRNPNPFTGFDRADDVKLASLRVSSPIPSESAPYVGPYPLINTSLNLVAGKELAWQERKAESFVFSPIYCGYEYVRGDQAPLRAQGRLSRMFGLLRHTRARWTSVGYRPTVSYAYPFGGVGLATAMAISGAAANPNMGYHSSTALSFLMTLFNVRLGWWMGNPRHDRTWRRWSPRIGLMYILSELTGNTTDDLAYINLSDGGHFENLGIYELVRRHCAFIVACDSEEDQAFTFGGLGNLVRKCRTDFGVDIDLSLDRVKQVKLSNEHEAHWVVGDILYPSGFRGKLLYIKSSLTGDEEVDVREYSWRAKAFPHQSTVDQFFDESQFESYRTLGRHVICSLPRIPGAKNFDDLFGATEASCARVSP